MKSKDRVNKYEQLEAVRMESQKQKQLVDDKRKQKEAEQRKVDESVKMKEIEADPRYSQMLVIMRNNDLREMMELYWSHFYTREVKVRTLGIFVKTVLEELGYSRDFYTRVPESKLRNRFASDGRIDINYPFVNMSLSVTGLSVGVSWRVDDDDQPRIYIVDPSGGAGTQHDLNDWSYESVNIFLGSEEFLNFIAHLIASNIKLREGHIGQQLEEFRALQSNGL